MARSWRRRACLPESRWTYVPVLGRDKSRRRCLVKHLVIGVGILAVASAFSTQALAQTSIPSDVHAKLSGYVGTWDFEERVKTTAAGAEKTITGRWHAAWIFESLIEWNYSDSDGMTGVEYEGYDPIIQNYTYWFNSDGSRGRAYDGEWDGNTLRIQFVETAPDGEVSRGRCTWPYNENFTALTSYTCEKLTDGTWWVFRAGTAAKADE